MENFVFTVTSPVNGTSSMGANSALNRAAGIIPANEMITGVELMTYLSVGSSGSTYNTLGTNQLGHIQPWVVAISYVPTGTTVPSLGANPDDSHFLMVQYVHPIMIGRPLIRQGLPLMRTYSRGTSNDAGGSRSCPGSAASCTSTFGTCLP